MPRSDLLFQPKSPKLTDAFAAFLRDVGIPGDSLLTVHAALRERFPAREAAPAVRWDLADAATVCPAEKFRWYLRRLGFIDAMPPLQRAPKYVVWPGGPEPVAHMRLRDIVGAWNGGARWKRTVVHAGKQPLGSETELGMMRRVWDQAVVDGVIPAGMAAVPVDWVDAPMKTPEVPGAPEGVPSASDALLHWLRQWPDPGVMMVSGGAPYGFLLQLRYDGLLRHFGFYVETFGHAAPDLTPTELMRELAEVVRNVYDAEDRLRQ